MRKENKHPNNIVPTQHDLDILDMAVFSYIKKYTNHASYNDLIGDSYIRLIEILEEYDPSKSNNKDAYIILKIKWHLSDLRRKKFKTRRKTKLKIYSLNDTLDEENEYLIMLESSDKTMEDILYEQQIVRIVKQTFGKIKKKRKNDWSGRDMFDALMLRMEGYTYKEIGNMTGYSESRISQIFSTIIMPKLEEVRNKLLNAL